MANFLASILDSSNVPSISASNNIVTLKDYSNYSTNVEAGHAKSDFSEFRKIKFINPDGTSYLLSTLGDGDALTIPASSASLPIVDTYTYSQGDGVYSVTLYTVPTWNSAVSYALITVPYVYYQGSVYMCVANSTDIVPGTDSTKWAVVSSIDSLPTKYRVYQPFVVMCDIQLCFTKKVLACNCSAVGCNYAKLSNDKNFMDADRLSLIMEGIPYLVNQGLWSLIADNINLAKQICCCLK